MKYTLLTDGVITPQYCLINNVTNKRTIWMYDIVKCLYNRTWVFVGDKYGDFIFNSHNKVLYEFNSIEEFKATNPELFL